MDSIRAHHRSLYQLSNALGGKQYSYDTITSEVSGENARRDYYGEDAWERLRAAKRKYDPRHVFLPRSQDVGVVKAHIQLLVHRSVSKQSLCFILPLLNLRFRLYKVKK